MNIYLLQAKASESPLWDSPYDKAWGFIIAADSESNARLLASAQAQDEGADAWLKEDHSTCKAIGFTYSFSSPRVILCEDIRG